VVDKTYVNDIRRAADPSEASIWERLSNDDKEFHKDDIKASTGAPLVDYKFFYTSSTSNTFADAKEFEGEWSWQLSGNEVWTADIELPGRQGRKNYDEGVRGDAGGRPYNENKVGDISPFREHFIRLLGYFPWS
jgi:hypothetical protein